MVQFDVRSNFKVNFYCCLRFVLHQDYFLWHFLGYKISVGRKTKGELKLGAVFYGEI